MEEMNCCERAEWIGRRDLAHARGFEFDLGECAGCGAMWLSVFCVATSGSGYERLSAVEVESIEAAIARGELKAFMKRWADERL